MGRSDRERPTTPDYEDDWPLGSTADELIDDDFGDPCHEFEHSIIFFITIIIAFTGFIIFVVLLAKRRITLAGHDILYLLILSFSFVRFGPKLWGALQVHGLQTASQTGCKLVAFTEFGLRHVNAYLLICLVVYGCCQIKYERINIDAAIRRHFPWFLISIFIVEGITGMTPAIYTDFDLTENRCDFTASEDISMQSFLAFQLLLSTIFPYILPFLCLVYPVVGLTKAYPTIDDPMLRSSTRNIVVVLWTHIALSTPWALHAAIMLPLLQGWEVSMDTVTVCIIDGLFRLFLESWYAIVPMVVIIGDPELGKDLPGMFILYAIMDKFHSFKVSVLGSARMS